MRLLPTLAVLLAATPALAQQPPAPEPKQDPAVTAFINSLTQDVGEESSQKAQAKANLAMANKNLERVQEQLNAERQQVTKLSADLAAVTKERDALKTAAAAPPK